MEQNYQVDLTRNQIRPTTDLRVTELRKNSKPLSFPVKDFKSSYPLITKEDITIGRNITGSTFLYTDEEHSHVLNAVQTSLPPDNNEIRLTEEEMKNHFIYAKTERFTLQKLCDAQKMTSLSAKYAKENV